MRLLGVCADRSLTEFHIQLMGLILHKGSTTNTSHYISIVQVGDIWFECDEVKITTLEFNKFCNSNIVYMLFYKFNKCTMETFKVNWYGTNKCHVHVD